MLLATMQQPLPELTRLDLQNKRKPAPLILASFLGGSAPRLQEIRLCRIRFPGLPNQVPNFFLSVTNLHLYHRKIPHDGYILPEAMVTGLSVSTRLECLILTFKSPQCRPDRAIRSPPPQTRGALLPVLTR
jgi:hypothetical protein